MSFASIGVGWKATKDRLFLALPKDKPPFIGIIHEALDASILPKDFLETSDNEVFLYFHSNYISIRVQMSHRNVVRFHSMVHYDRAELLLWLDKIRDSESIVFGHLMKKDPKPEMVKCTRTKKLYYFTVKRLFVMDFKDKSAVRIIR